VASKILVQLVGDSRSLERSFNKAGKSAQGFNKNMTSSSKASRRNQGVMRGLGGSVRFASGAFLGGAGLIAGITATLSKTAEFEKSLNTFQAVTKATGAQMKAVGAVAQKLGGDITLPGTSAKDAALAMTELAKGGLSVRQSMAAAKGTLQLAAAGEVEVGDAATISARALNAFGLSGDQAGRVADVLANAANASTGEISDFALGLQQSSASANAAGLSIEDTTTALGLLANKGIAGSDAGTSFKTMLARLVPSTKKASDEMRLLGVRYKDADGNLLPLREQVAQYTQALGRLKPAARQQAINTLFGSDASRAANIILGAGVKKYDEMHRAISRQGAAAQIAAAKQKGLAGAMDGLKSAVETVQIQIGTALAPVITKYLKVASAWLGNSKNQKTILNSLNATIATVAASLRILRSIFRTLSTVLHGNRNAVIALVAAYAAFKALNIASSVASAARSFGLLGRNARTAGVRMKGAQAASVGLRGSLLGKAGLVGAAGLAAFAITSLILKATGLDKKLKDAGGSAFDLAAKLGLVNDNNKQFEGKTILGPAGSRAIRQQAARLEAAGLSPTQAATKIAARRPNLALHDIQVLAGVFGQQPQLDKNSATVVVHTHVELDKQKVGTAVTKHQQVLAKRNPRQKRGPNAG
jgi:TP901 family phage tail tape measure protein